jgi:hypothetical protein
LITQPGGDQETFALGEVTDAAEPDGSYSAGETIVDLVGDVSAWPPSGALTIRGGLYSGQSFAYQLAGSQATLSPVLPFALAGNELVERVAVGGGLGDATESGHPVLADGYTNVGATGGRLSDGR